MTEDNLVKTIMDIVIKKTVNLKIPTVVFLSEIDKGSLVKNIIWSIKGGNQEEDKFMSNDWEKVAEIMQNLAEIPLLLKETSDVNEIRIETENFIKEINKGKGVVIINNNELASNLECKNQSNIFTHFTTNENVSIIVVSK